MAAAAHIGRLMPRLQPAAAPDYRIGLGVRCARAMAVNAPIISKTGRMVLRAVVETAGTSNVCWATCAELADKAGLSSRTVRRQLKELQQDLLEVRYVQRGGKLPDGTTSMFPRLVITVKDDLPLVGVHGVNGNNLLAYDREVDLKPGPRSTLDMVLTHANHKGETFVGAKRIAELLKVHPRTVMRHLRELEFEGHVTSRFGPVGASGHRQVVRQVHPRRGPSRRRLERDAQHQTVATVQPQTAWTVDAHRGQIVPEGVTGCSPKKISQEDPQLAFAFMTQRVATPAPRVDPVAAAVLETHERVCKARKARDGDGAVELVKAMLSEGLTPRDLGKAFSGVMTMAYRRERLVRREIGAVLQTKAQAISFIKRVDPERAEQIEKSVPTPPTKSELERIRQDVRHLCAAKRPDFSCR